MWRFGKGQTQVWTTLKSDWRSSVDSLEKEILFSNSKQFTSNNTYNEPFDNFAVIWDQSLGTAPFSNWTIKNRLLSTSFTSIHDKIPSHISKKWSHIFLNQLKSPKYLEKLIFVIGSSLSHSRSAMESLLALIFENSSNSDLSDSRVIIKSIYIYCPNSERLKNQPESFTQWISDSSSVSPSNIFVFHNPLLISPLSDKFFHFLVDSETDGLGVHHSNIQPQSERSFSSGSDLLAKPLKTENRVKMSVEFDDLPRNVQEKYRIQATTFENFAARLNVNFETWALGPASTILAQQMAQENQTKHNNTDSREKVSLIFIDRNLDLIPPCSLGSNSTIDRFQNIQAYSTIRESICNSKTNQESYDNLLELLSVAVDQQIHDALEQFLAILSKPSKAALDELLRMLVEVASNENIELNLSTSGIAGAENALMTFLQAIVESKKMELLHKHRFLVWAINFALNVQDQSIVIQSSETDVNASVLGIHELSCLKHVLATQGDLQSVVSYLEEYGTDTPVSIIFRVVVSFCMFAKFIQPGNSQEQDVSQSSKIRQLLQNLILRASVDDIKALPALFDDIKEDLIVLAKSKIQDQVEKANIEHVAKPSNQLSLILENRLEEIFDYIENESPIEYEDFQTYQESHRAPSLVSQVVDRVFDPSKPELHDLQQVSFTVTGLLKTGISMIGLRSLPRPSDRNTTIVYVLGGITLREVMEIREALRSLGTKNEVIIASNRIISSFDMADLYCSGHL